MSFNFIQISELKEESKQRKAHSVETEATKQSEIKHKEKWSKI